MTRLLLVCSALFLLPWIVRAGSHHRASPGGSDDIVPRLIIVKFKPGIAPGSGSLSKAGDALHVSLAREGVKSLARTFPEVESAGTESTVEGRVDLSQIYYATIGPENDVHAVALRIGRMPEVEYAEPKYLQRPSEVPNDTLFGRNQAGYFSRLNAIAGWGIAKGSSSVTIAAVDGGTYWQHEDLIGNLWVDSLEDINHNGRFDPGPASAGGDADGIDQDGDGKVDDVIGWNFTNNSNNPRGLVSTPQSRAHGTATASHFGAVTNNVLGMAGSSWNCRLMPICVASATGDNSIEFGYEGIQFAFSHGAQVINCSWGRLGAYSQFERDVVTAATQAGSLVVAAAGNDSVNIDTTPEYPAGFPEVFGIGATNSTDDAKAWFSNYGVNVSVFAPGTNIWSALDGGGYANGGSGTSYSSPIVAGLAGIIKSIHPFWTPEQIRAQILVTSDSIDLANPSLAGVVGRGRANFARALTESHAGIQVLAASVLSPSGRTFFILGDTVVVSLIVKNILTRDAANLQFTVSSHEASLQPLTGPVTLTTLAQGQQTVLPPLMLKLGTLGSSRIASVVVRWVSNGNERDAVAYRVYLFPTMPRWFLQLPPVTASLFSVKAVSPAVAWAAGGSGNASAPSVIRTTDGGESWTNMTGTLAGVDLYCITAVDQTHAWVGSSDGRIFATSNAGLTWRQQTYPGRQSPFIDGIWFFDVNNGFALGDPDAATNKYIILKTTDGGATWAHLPSEPLAGAGEAGWNNSFWWSDPRHGWFGTNQFRIRGTTDGGVTWVTGPTNSQNSLGVSFRDSLNGVAAFDDGYAQVTTDGGKTWTSRNKPAQAATLVSVAYAPGTNAVWTTDGFLPYRSTDAGRSWTAELTYPFDGSIQHLSVADSAHGWASTSFGKMLHYSADTTVVTPPAGAASFTLEQNFPNPFSSTTTIRFTLPAPLHVSVTLYDLLGRRVRVLFEGDRESGMYETEVSSAGLASGVYFYQIRAGDYEGTRKMLVLH
jgi:photosystem II stability/assembly factor-like uncharacterized protein